MNKWIGRPSPKSMHTGTGWVRELNKAWTDGEYAVMSRVVKTDWGDVIHACMRNTDNTDIPWAEKQRIKNDLFGVESTAIEVFPAQTDLVDEANMYHFWVLPQGIKLPFGLKEV
ncbi:hypothetical protein MMB75_25355 [Paenibacillus sp. P2(2022)]|uniref:DUF7694 domain-containing protein n=1 Tax=Paenibacillus sp. P2(2022) TaxID=2917813 RepID=UPI002406A3A8|nr:hypothetical protein [Paenibacillus sp. P2(2022)]MDG0056956.1 hypothetical protein [Paenibacillus sp. P2(2022)]